jgi:hypothetical protein
MIYKIHPVNSVNPVILSKDPFPQIVCATGFVAVELTVRLVFTPSASLRENSF